MGFFNSLGAIYKNKSNFELWEKQEADNDAKRKALYEKYPLSQAELAQKKKFADTIIDTITIMDQHSEDVAEDVETALEPIAQTSSVVGLGVSAWLMGLHGIKKGRKCFANANNILEKLTEDDLKAICEANKNIKNLNKKAIVSPSKKLMKKMVIPSNLTSTVKNLRNDYSKALAPMKKLAWLTPVVVIASMVVTYFTAVFATTKMQIESSRVARYQARNELKDPKNFVVYTDEQIAQAKENLKNKKPKTEKKTFFSKFKSEDDEKTGLIATYKNLKKLIADNKKYKAWKKANQKRDPRVMRQLTPEEIAEAKRDKDVIQRLTKKINNKAEEYSENMETAATVVVNSSFIGGAVLGGGMSWIMNKLSLGEKFATFTIRKLAGEEVVKEFNNIKNIKLKDLKSLQAIQKFKTVAEQSVSGLKKGLVMLAATPWGRNKLIGFTAGFVSSIVGSLIVLKMQKQASRAGRYIAKEEFKNNPQEFISYSDEKMNEVKDVKAKEKTLGQKFKEYISFVPRAFKHHNQYMKYKKGQYKKDKALREELVKLNVSAEQLREGKNLQRKLFNTFEKIDDKSQEYSEHMEAATEIATQVSYWVSYSALWAPILIPVIAVASGKTSVSKMIGNIVDFLSRFTFIGKTKFTKKYIADVAENIGSKIKNQSVNEVVSENAFIKILLNGIDSFKLRGYNGFERAALFSAVKAPLQKVSEAGVELSKVFDKIDKKQVQKLLRVCEELKDVDVSKLEPFLKNKTLKDLSDTKILGEMLGLLTKKETFTQKELQALSELVKKLSNVKDLAETKATNLLETIKQFCLSKCQNDTVKANFEKIIKEGTGLYSKYKERFTSLFNNKLTEFLSSNSGDKEKIITELTEFSASFLENKKFTAKMLRCFDRVIKNVPAEELDEAFKKILNIACAEPEKFIAFCAEPTKFKASFMTNSLRKVLRIAGISYGTFIIAMTFAVQSYFAKLQKEAGRLGVMKAMEELQDDRIYADVEPKLQIPAHQSTTPADMSKLPDNIQKLLKTSAKS